MSLDTAHALLNYEIAKIPFAPTPWTNLSYVSGLIDMAVMLDQLTFDEGQCYQQALEIKVGNRTDQLRRAA